MNISRLNALEKYQILDTLPEKVFDDIVELASAICNTPISLISLLDSDRQWFKAKVGLDAPQTPIEYSFCSHAVKDPKELFVVPNSLLDERFKHNPLVTGDPHIRFYAGAPLITPDGHALGALCVIDDKPREFTEEQSRLLKILADKVVKEMELRKESHERQQQVDTARDMLKLTLTRLLEAEKIAHIGNWDWDIEKNEIFWSPEMFRLFGLVEEQFSPVTIDNWTEKVHPEDIELVKETIQLGFINEMPGEVEYRIIRPDGKVVWLHGRGTVSVNDEGKVVRLKGTASDVTERKKAEAAKLEYMHALEEMLFSFSHKIRRPVASCLGLIDILSSQSAGINAELIEYFKSCALELDQYTQELTGFLHGKKVKITGEG